MAGPGRPGRPGRIELETRIDAPPEVVFSYLIDPAKLVIWEGEHAALDPTPGGIFRVVLKHDYVMRGEFVEVTPPTRLVITFGWEHEGGALDQGSTLITYELSADGDGTLLRFTHSGLPERRVDDHTRGWTRYMGRLKVAAEGGNPGEDAITKRESS